MKIGKLFGKGPRKPVEETPQMAEDRRKLEEARKSLAQTRERASIVRTISRELNHEITENHLADMLRVSMKGY